MSAQSIARLLALYAVGLVVVSLCVHGSVALTPDPAHPRAVVASVWQNGALVARVVLPTGQEKHPSIDEAMASPGSELVLESSVAEGPIVTRSETALSISLVSGHDGVVGTLDGTSSYVTPDDLLARRAYDRGVNILGIDLGLGADTAVIYALLADRLHTTPRRVREEAKIRRVRFTRSTPGRPTPPWAHVDGGSLTPAIVRGAAIDAARYLARNLREDGHFRYLVDAPSNRQLGGYDWPRHAGATYFLAQAAGHFHEPELAEACLRAASLLRNRAVSNCGDAQCIGTDVRVDLGSSALSLIAFVEIVRTGLDTGYFGLVRSLSRFLREQQRADGEFMHEYDRRESRPVDVQYVYYSGEATLALARADEVTHDENDLTSAKRGLSHLVRGAWHFFGDRYYFGEEHWTCQAMADLWGRSPDRGALDFCERWQAYGRKLQLRAGDAIYDADGAIGLSSIFTPRLTPVASRCEAGIATLDVLLREDARGVEELDAQQRRALALLVRRQLRPGPVAIFSSPDSVYGAMPGSEVDLALRIDYAQHAGSAMIRWLDLSDPARDVPRRGNEGAARKVL
jgi:hypothetical protein